MGVQPRRDNITDDFDLVHLYLEDLRAIEKILRSLGGDEESLTVTGPQYEAPTVDELLEVESGTVRELSIRRHRPSAYVSVRGSGVTYSVEDSTNLEHQGAATRIAEIIKNARQPLPVRAIRHPWVTMIGGAGILGSSMGTLATSNPEQLSDVAGVLVSIPLAIGLVALSYYSGIKYSAKATLSERAQTPGFFARNRDELIVRAISAFFGFIAGIAVTLVAQALIGP